MLKIYTGRVCYERRYKRLKVPYLNTTVKCGDKRFAPSWDIVMGVKSGEITPEEYTERYLAMMEESYRDNRSVWDQLLSLKGELILTCFCPAHKFCHRYLLAAFLADKAVENDIELSLAGEYEIDKPSFEGKEL